MPTIKQIEDKSRDFADQNKEYYKNYPVDECLKIGYREGMKAGIKITDWQELDETNQPPEGGTFFLAGSFDHIDFEWMEASKYSDIGILSSECEIIKPQYYCIISQPTTEEPTCQNKH